MNAICAIVFMLGCNLPSPSLHISSDIRDSSPVEYEWGISPNQAPRKEQQKFLNSPGDLADIPATNIPVLSSTSNTICCIIAYRDAPPPIIRIFASDSIIFYANGKKLITLYRDGRWEPGEGFRDSEQAGQIMFRDICAAFKACGDSK